MPRRTPSEKVVDVERFYGALRRLEQSLGGTRRLSDCDGCTAWPERGVYFFFEYGERRGASGGGPRVVRVGTHAVRRPSSVSGTSLWDRLRQHRGSVKTGGGNHRGSIFRLLVGAALAARAPGLGIDTWGCGSSAPREVRNREMELERRVSDEIGKMPLLWLNIDDQPGPESLRGYVERNAIALLAGDEAPSDGWLGRYCPSEKVRRSGLWNQQGVDDEYDPGFLSTFEGLISKWIDEGLTS